MLKIQSYLGRLYDTWQNLAIKCKIYTRFQTVSENEKKKKKQKKKR